MPANMCDWANIDDDFFNVLWAYANWAAGESDLDDFILCCMQRFEPYLHRIGVDHEDTPLD